jgi:hypothetical protein
MLRVSAVSSLKVFSLLFSLPARQTAKCLAVAALALPLLVSNA